MTYQEKNFLSSLEKFKQECFSEAQIREERYIEWKKAFIAEYPRDSIIEMQMNDYLISHKRSGNPYSFCRKIYYELNTVFHINISNKTWAENFGIALKNGTKLTLSSSLAAKFGNDFDSAFTYIKNEIITLLDEVDKENYAAIESCKLSYDMKYILLIIYCPEKILPVCNRELFYRYCEITGITNDYYKEMIYNNNLLIQWKNDVPEISNWSNSIFTSFCDWLYRKNRYIDGNSLRSKARINMATIEEINNLNIQGISKETVVKVRINQGIFRDKLLQRYSCCCLCGVSNQRLLIASHIKPWSASEPDEKLDVDNGFLMCPNHDLLFDEGWITFSDEGKIIIADRLLKNDRIALNVNDNMNILLTDKNKKYLKYHRNVVFQNT